MKDSKKCSVCGSEMELWKGKKWICTNDKCVNVELADLRPWFVELAENLASVDEKFLSHAPSFVACEFSALRDMLNKGEVSGLVLKIKDVFEVILKFSVLPILSEWMNDGDKKNLYREILYGLTRKLPSLGDWYGAAQKIFKAGEISNGALKKILADVLKIYEAEKIIHWRNVNVGHGAYTSAEDKIFRADVKEKIQALAEHCNNCAEDYAAIKIYLKQGKKYVSLRGLASAQKGTRSSGELYLEGTRKKFPLAPLMKNIDGGICFFDSYLLKKKRLAYLNYANGKKMENADKDFDALYKKLTTTLRIVQTEISAEEKIRGNRAEEALEEILKPDEFIRFDFLSDRLDTLLAQKNRGIFLLEMKNGTGKTVFAKLLDGLAYKKIRLKAENIFCRAFYINSVYSYSKLTFIQGLTDVLRHADNGETLKGDIPTVDTDAADAKAQVAKLINELFAAHKKLFGKEKLLLIIDGVDELPNTGERSLIDLIPDAALLADGIYLLLTCRPPAQTSDYTKHILTVPTFDEKFSVDEDAEEYLGVLRKFIAEKTSATPATVEKILNAADKRLINLKNIIEAYIRVGDRCFENPTGNVFEILRTLYGEHYYDEIFHFAAILAALPVPVTVKELAQLADEESVTFKLLTYIGELKPILNISRNVDGTLVSVTRPEVRKFLRDDEKIFKKIYGAWNNDLQANNSTDDDKIFLLKYLGLCSAEKNFLNNFAQKNTFVKISKAVVPKLNYQSERDYLFATVLLKILCREIAPLFAENKFIKQLEVTVFVVQNLAEVAKTYGGKISETVDSLKQIFKLIREKNFDLPTQFDFATMLGTMLAKTNHGAEAENYFALANECFEQIDATLKSGKNPQANRDGILNKLSVIKNLIEQAVKDKNLSNYNAAEKNLNRAQELIDEPEKYFADMIPPYLLSLKIQLLKTFGNIYKRQEPEKALKYFSEAKKILDAFDEDDAQFHGAKYDLLLNMGQAYRALKDYGKAAELYDEGIALIEAMKIRGELFETEYLVSLYNSRGNVERDLENHAASIKFYGKALEIADAERKAGKFINPNLYSSIKNSLATAYEKTDNLTTASQLRGSANTAELNKSHLLHSAPAEEKIFFRNAADDDELYEHAMDLIYEINASNRQRDGIKLLHEAANEGNVKAMNILGMAYCDGQIAGFIVGRKPVEAVKWFSKAAELGHLGAMNELGQMYLFGEGVEKDIDKAIELLIEAANLGNAQSMFILGRLYHFGDKIPRNEQKAFEWYSRAAENGMLPARKNLLLLKNFMARIEKLGDDTDAIAKAHEAETLFLAGATKQNIDEKLNCFEKSAALGNADALASIGTMYLNGYGVKKDVNKARELLQKAVDAGSALALGALGVMYESGTGVEKNYAKALKYFQRAADKGDEQAMANLGRMYLSGKGVKKEKKDFDKAFEWLKKSVELGNVAAVNNLARMHYEGYSRSRFFLMTNLLLDVLTTRLDNRDAWALLVTMFGVGNIDRKYFDRFINLINKAVDLYCPEAMAQLGFMYLLGDGVPQSHDKALTWVKKAQKLGSYIVPNVGRILELVRRS